MNCQRCGTELHGLQRKWCSENCRKRAWEAEWLASDKSRRPCPQCGGLMGAGTARPSDGARACRDCREARTLAKRRQVHALWHQGASLVEIAGAMGWPPTQVSVEVNRLRERGWDLPYRYPQRSPFAKPRFPDQVAA